jgi:hypothetical protein
MGLNQGLTSTALKPGKIDRSNINPGRNLTPLLSLKKVEATFPNSKGKIGE